MLQNGGQGSNLWAQKLSQKLVKFYNQVLNCMEMGKCFFQDFVGVKTQKLLLVKFYNHIPNNYVYIKIEMFKYFFKMVPKFKIAATGRHGSTSYFLCAQKLKKIVYSEIIKILQSHSQQNIDVKFIFQYILET